MSTTRRKPFAHEGRTIYEWEQSLEEIIVYIDIPDERLRARDFDIKISAQHVTVGIRGNPPYLDADLDNAVDANRSIWMLEDGEIVITLHKALIGAPWASAFSGHASLDPIALQEEQKQLMLERFGRENPQFDFSGAQFNGSAPNPREFMGGVEVSKLKK